MKNTSLTLKKEILFVLTLILSLSVFPPSTQGMYFPEDSDEDAPQTTQQKRPRSESMDEENPSKKRKIDSSTAVSSSYSFNILSSLFSTLQSTVNWFFPEKGRKVSLPDELVEDIFLRIMQSNLSIAKKLGCTNKYFHKLFCDPRLNLHIKIDSPGKMEELLKPRSDDLPYVQHLTISYWFNDFNTTSLDDVRKKYTNLASLNMGPGMIGNESAPIIAQMLNNTALKSLGFGWGYKFDNKGAKIIAKALHNNFSLTKLDLPCNRVLTQGNQAITEALINKTSLTHLALHSEEKAKDKRNNVIKNIALILKNNPKITYLQLSGIRINEIGSREMLAVLKTRSSLATLALSNNGMGPRDVINIINGLSAHPMLTSLSLDWNDVGLNGAKTLGDADLYNLKSLSLRKCNLADTELKALSTTKLTSLTKLSLENNRVGNEGALSLTKFSTLVTLDVNQENSDGEHITAIGMEGFANGRWEFLTDLSLNHQNIGPEGAGHLANGTLFALTFLNLTHNNIGWEGTAALAEGKLSSLTQLNLCNNDIQCRGARVLSQGKLTALKTLTLSDNNIGHPGASWLAIGTFSPSLMELNLSYNRIGNDGVKCLAEGELISLASLRLSNNSIEDEGGKALVKGNFTMLTYLDLWRNNVSSTIQDALRKKYSRAYISF